MPTFYGLGWNVSYDEQGRLRLNHSGAFDLGAATYVNLVPAEQLGIVVLTNGYPMGIAEALGTTFSDIALYGKPTQDWFPLYKQRFRTQRQRDGASALIIPNRRPRPHRH